jgi:tetratricopeptide (TPR) repeat protein
MPPDQPVHPAAADPAGRLVQQGVALAQAGQLDQALRLFGDALRLRPGDPQAQHNLGVALAATGRLAEAARALQAALAARPDYAEAHYNLGNVLNQLRRPDDAIAAFRRALQVRPDYAEALNNLGLALTLSGRPEEGLILLRQALRLMPGLVEARGNEGLALTELGEYAAAADCFERVLRDDPRQAEAHSNLGNNYKEQGRLAEALACYDLAVALRPDAPSPHWNRALTLLQQGDYERGWAEYEWRRRKPDSGIRPLPQPAWDGGPLHGRTILLHLEQGLGDALQFIRYAPRVQARGGSVMVAGPRRLLPLLSRCPGIDRLVAEEEALPPFDVHAPLLSLPALLRTTLATVPAEAPYLFANEALIQKWRAELPGAGTLRVGIAWQGNPRHRKDRWRSIPLTYFAPLARVQGVCLVSLQQGPGVEQLGGCGFVVERLGGAVDEAAGAFMDTAAVMMNLDLVVTADTAAAHLAGGLGVPVWVALAKVPDWRWLLGRADSPWYPTARLFRQEEAGRWGAVIEAMARELESLVERRRRAGMATVEVAAGELLDRIAILQIKARRLTDPEQLRHVRADLAGLEAARQRSLPGWQEHKALVEELRTVNAALWDVEDGLRDCERRAEFGPPFVDLARSVYRYNDRRSVLKRQLSERLGAGVYDQKSYAGAAIGAPREAPR